MLVPTTCVWPREETLFGRKEGRKGRELKLPREGRKGRMIDYLHLMLWGYDLAGHLYYTFAAMLP